MVNLSIQLILNVNRERSRKRKDFNCHFPLLHSGHRKKDASFSKTSRTLCIQRAWSCRLWLSDELGCFNRAMVLCRSALWSSLMSEERNSSLSHCPVTSLPSYSFLFPLTIWLSYRSTSVSLSCIDSPSCSVSNHSILFSFHHFVSS